MKYLIAIGSIGLILALAALISGAFEPSSLDYARQNAEIASLQRQESIDRTLQPLDTALAAVWRLVPVVITAGVLGYLASLGVAHIARFRHERKPDVRGLLPINAYQLEAVAPQALGAFHAARQLEAAKQNLPATLTYAPHYSHRADTAGIPLLPADVASPITAPNFSELLDAGRIGKGNPMLLGIDKGTGKPIEGSWLDLYSCAVGGISGSGKTWTAAFLAAQAALHGARLVVLDPHSDNPESLASRLAPMSSRYVCEVADNPKSMLASVNLVAAELQQRKDGKRGEPWLFIADEFSALQRGELADPLAKLVEALGQEGRKVFLYGMVCGQVWTAARAGGSELRDSLASAYVHRLRPAQARMLTGFTAADLPGDLLELPAGSAYLLSTAGELRPVIIPRMAPGDIARVAQLAGSVPGDQASTQASTKRQIGFHIPESRKPDGSLTEACNTQASRASLSAEALRVLELFQRGLDIVAIVKEIYGIEASSGRKYQDAARDVQRLLREALAS